MATVDSLDKGQDPADGSKLAELVRYYRDTATMHGVTQITGKKLYTFRRCLWGLMMVGMLSGLSTMMYMHFYRYALHPTVNVVNAYMTDSVPFPAVTVCNLNQFRSNRIPNESRLRELLFRLSDFALLRDIMEEGEKSHETDVDVTVETGEQLRSFAMEAAHTLHGMFKFCVWRSRRMSCEDILNKTVTDLGVCYTFNADRRTPRLNATDSGPLGGLRLLMSIEQDLYYFSAHTQSGIKVLLHEPDEVPLLTNRGFFVRPGTCTDVVIRREQRIGLAKPYKAFGNSYCLNTHSPDFRSPLTKFHNVSFTETACWKDCFTRRMVELCGCRHFYDPGDDKFCSIDELQDCYLPTAGTTSQEDVMNCQCETPCSEVNYPTSLSFTDFASKFVVQHMFNTNLVNNPSYVRENLIEMRIYYDTLTVSEVLQQPEMTVMGILGNVGGHMGLFLGASILSVTEILELILLALFSCLLGRWSAFWDRPVAPASSTEKTNSIKSQADSAF